MKTFKFNFPLILLAVLELALGILLFVAPDALVKWAIYVLGGVMIVLGVVNLIRYFTVKEPESKSPFTLVGAGLCLIVGALAIVLNLNGFLMDVIEKTIAVLAILFGIILIVTGLYKLQAYVEMKKAGIPVSFVTLIGIVLSALLGVAVVLIAILNPASTKAFVFIFTGVALVVQGVTDIAALIHAAILRKAVKESLAASAKRSASKNASPEEKQ